MGNTTGSATMGPGAGGEAQRLLQLGRLETSALVTTNTRRSRLERRIRSSRNCRSEAVRIWPASSRKMTASARGT
jgi:hypothetical protein